VSIPADARSGRCLSRTRGPSRFIVALRRMERGILVEVTEAVEA
jgi:hypothetical protein